MDPDINPVVRVIGIIVVCTIPIAVVLLQRLDAVKLIIRDIKEGKFSLSFDGLVQPEQREYIHLPKVPTLPIRPTTNFAVTVGRPFPLTRKTKKFIRNNTARPTSPMQKCKSSLENGKPTLEVGQKSIS